MRAREAASEAVLQTQFDYTDNNKPRYFKAFPGARAIMMFKMYSQGMYALLASSTVQSFRGKSAVERSQARKTLAGLIATHKFLVLITSTSSFSRALNCGYEKKIKNKYSH